MIFVGLAGCVCVLIALEEPVKNGINGIKGVISMNCIKWFC